MTTIRTRRPAEAKRPWHRATNDDHSPRSLSRFLVILHVQVASGYIFLTGDIRWTPANTIKFPLLCISAGLFAGLFGVGGGIVKVGGCA